MAGQGTGGGAAVAPVTGTPTATATGVNTNAPANGGKGASAVEKVEALDATGLQPNPAAPPVITDTPGVATPRPSNPFADAVVPMEPVTGGQGTFGSGVGGGKGGGTVEAPDATSVSAPPPPPPPIDQAALPINLPANAVAPNDPLAPQGFNVNNAAAGGLQQAMLGTQNVMNAGVPLIGAAQYNPSQTGATGYAATNAGATGYDAATTGATGYNAAQAGATGYNASQAGNVAPVTANNVTANQLATTSLSNYTNPYENQVVQTALNDLAGVQQQTMNQIGAQAEAANAFGGSRQALVESESLKNFAKTAADTASRLRQLGYTQAQDAALKDIGNTLQADLSNQGANLQAGTTSANLAQNVNLANQAATNTASQFGAQALNNASSQNAAAQNTAAQFGAGALNTAGLANQAAQNTAAQFGAGALNTAGLTNAAAQNTANQFGASAMNTAALSNQAANNAAGQFNASAQNTANLANQGALIGNQAQQLNAANQLGNLAGQAFNTSQAITQQQQSAGLLQQGLQQALIDAAQGQFAGYANSPANALSAPLAALGVAPVPQTTTQTNNPGLLNYLQVLAMM